jgi:hypothetical protein
VPHLEQELFSLPEQLNLPSVLSDVRVTRSLVLCVHFIENTPKIAPNPYFVIMDPSVLSLKKKRKKTRRLCVVPKGTLSVFRKE